MSYTYDPYWQQRIADTFSCALNAYTRLLALRVDLRLPDTPAATDAAVISRFTDSLKARIDALQTRQRREGKRVWPTSLMVDTWRWCSTATGPVAGGLFSQAGDQNHR